MQLRNRADVCWLCQRRRTYATWRLLKLIHLRHLYTRRHVSQRNLSTSTRGMDRHGASTDAVRMQTQAREALSNLCPGQQILRSPRARLHASDPASLDLQVMLSPARSRLTTLMVVLQLFVLLHFMACIFWYIGNGWPSVCLVGLRDLSVAMH